MKGCIQKLTSTGSTDNSYLFDVIADDLLSKGYSINPVGFDTDLAESLLQAYLELPSNALRNGGIGRSSNHTLNDFVRRDEICWINDSSVTTTDWLNWVKELQIFLNRRLMLGLFSFESHFARYRKGQFYKRHLDSFKGSSNRVVSIVLYLNKDWTLDDAGQLVLYKSEADKEGTWITPTFGTLVVFLSEDFPHEVLTAKRERISIAGWYKVNTSTNRRVDPPR